MKNNSIKIIQAIQNSIAVKQQILNDPLLLKTLEQITKEIILAYQRDHKVLLCGNGGSAADAQHLAAELSGKFYFDRKPLYAEALHVNA
jgi:D-sedoheptulose 7-phosphate isomerase